MRFEKIDLSGKTYYLNACRVHPNPTSTEYSVWEADNGHSTVSYSNSAGIKLGKVGARRFECEHPRGPERSSAFAEHRGAQREVVMDVFAAAGIDGTYDSDYFEMRVDD